MVIFEQNLLELDSVWIGPDFFGCIADDFKGLADYAMLLFQVNRSSMTFLARQAFAKMFKSDPDDLVRSSCVISELRLLISYYGPLTSLLGDSLAVGLF